MKKLLIPMIALAVALAASVGAYAYGPGGGGRGVGCGNCTGPTAAQQEQFKKFQQDTIELRQQMMSKRFDLQREELKTTPDAARLTALQGEIGALQTKIHDIRVKSGLPVGRSDGACGSANRGMGMGHGMGMGRGMARGGCAGSPCYGPAACR